ncbi:MAG TPA: methionyl-tRNA formyltransferase, partial [Actinomycetota bacterium]|nr:methionyl-tRNA formyltransferase [Actinomycetota bacterium]
MRVVFLGNAPASVASLERLERSTNYIALVVTRAPRPAGRGGRPRATPVAEAARRLGLPLAEVETVKDGPGFEAIRDARPDVLVVVAYGEIIRRAVLDLPRIAPVNVHFSLLPRLRGADPVRRAIRDGLDTTGVTTMRMDEGLDTGPVLLQREAPSLPDDDAGALGERRSRLGAELLVDTLDALERGEITERPQDDTLATRAPKL